MSMGMRRGAPGHDKPFTPVGGSFYNSVLSGEKQEEEEEEEEEEATAKGRHAYDKRPTYLRAAEMQAAEAGRG